MAASLANRAEAESHRRRGGLFPSTVSSMEIESALSGPTLLADGRTLQAHLDVDEGRLTTTIASADGVQVAVDVTGDGSSEFESTVGTEAPMGVALILIKGSNPSSPN